MQQGRLSAQPDAIAPDGSDIRLAGSVRGGSLVDCTLPPGKVSAAVRHRTVEELWLCVGGRGEVWRKLGADESVAAVEAGCWLTIPLGAHFQFRCTGAALLRFVIATVPPWPGEGEAERVEDFWRVA
jgi:mannose-6-phosphate isomerase-like protein (cupin superfamily)